jgi:thiamine-monophosphate kinase
VINLGFRQGLDAVFFDRLYQGLGRAARAAGVDVVGGNITRSAQLTITIALLGEVARQALRRDTAREGDEIFVTGTLGDAALGWRIMAGKLRARNNARKFLVARFVAPPARLTAGRKLARMRPLPAAIDISDGLLQDLGHILERSGVGAEVELEAVPRSSQYLAVMQDQMDLALSGGEDYELLFCIRTGHSPQQLSHRLETPVQRIGRIVNRKQGLRLREPGGRLISPAGARGWDQLGGKPAKDPR